MQLRQVVQQSVFVGMVMVALLAGCTLTGSQLAGTSADRPSEDSIFLPFIGQAESATANEVVDTPTAPVSEPISQTGALIPGEYIVVFKQDLVLASSVSAVAAEMAALYGGQVTHDYSSVMPGFAAQFPAETSAAAVTGLQQHPNVAYVEPNRVITLDPLATTGTVEETTSTEVGAANLQANPPSWGLSRISTRSLNLASPFIYNAISGRGVTVYVLDTGIQYTHTDFGGRASVVKSMIPGETTPDGNGHGTHIAGTIGASTYGVAKLVTIKGVKVLNAAGSGTYAHVIAGIEFVVGEVRRNTSRRLNTVLLMGLTVPKSQAVDDAANAAVDAGVVVIVAAGNHNGDACTLSPAGAAKVFTVGATDNTDMRATYSNWGTCVELFAPGSNIRSLWKGTNGVTNTLSGTSMATSHVAGVAALFLAEKDFTKAVDVYNDLMKASTKNVVKNPGVGSPNLLLFSQNIPN